MSKTVKPFWKIGLPWLVAPTAGLITGLSAPGFDQWYLAWFGLAPLFYMTGRAQKWWHAALSGWMFGIAFNLVWLSWFLKINLPPWVGLREPQQMLVVGAICWLLCAVLYGMAIGWSCVALWLVRRLAGRWNTWQILELFGGALVFTATSIFLSDKPDLLLLPLASLEYTQYNNQALIQIAAIIGGAGLQYLVVLNNLAFANVGSAWRDSRKAAEGTGENVLIEGKIPALPGATASPSSSTSLRSAGIRLLISLSLACAATIYGAVRLSVAQPSADIAVSVFQSGFMLDVMRTGKGVSAAEVLSQNLPVLKRCPPGLVVWTETSLPMPFDKSSGILEAMRQCAKDRKLDIVFGIEETAAQKDKAYNASAGISSSGEFADGLYRKQYLIPFGEFEPLILRIIPQSLKNELKLPDVPPFLPGTSPRILKLTQGDVAPLICGENVQAALCAKSVRAGGSVIANISNLSWFQGSILGPQTIAIGTIRAVENHRYYIYAADTGPSFIVDGNGKLLARMNWLERGVLQGKVRYLRDLTPFTHMSF